MSSQTPVLQAQGLGKVYGEGDARCVALAGADLSILPGDQVALVGRSGSGKSTLAHLLALLDTPSEGRVLVDGVDVSRVRGKARDQLRNEKFGFVFQQFFLNPRQTVAENVSLPLVIRGTGRRQIRRLVHHQLQALGLDGLADRLPTQLSGGQRQRVCVARALVGSPAVLLADEPTGNLDRVSGELVEQAVFGLAADLGTTLVVVTHDQELAARCDRQVLVDDGTVHELERRPLPCA